MKTLIVNAQVINENSIEIKNVLISNQIIEAILPNTVTPKVDKIVDASGLYLMPGCIDDQVHFREPGLTHKGDIYSESKAAVAGGITSFMEMPNTIPNTLTQDLLEQKFEIAKQKSLANFSFYMGVSNDNLIEVLKTNPNTVCGVKVFMGSSTGNMLVDNTTVLENLFSNCNLLIATHCEDEETIKHNLQLAKAKYGNDIPINEHPKIRSENACYLSSSRVVELAQKHNTRLHVLHISTKKELGLFTNKLPPNQKRITSEACVHHLWFCEDDYKSKGNLIKWNPAIKTDTDRTAILKAVIDGTIDVVATDHAPHTFFEKSKPYLEAPSGGPLVQHSLQVMLELFHQKKISLEKIVQTMCHQVADIFSIQKRGYLREGYFADLVLVNLNKPYTVTKSNILAKCSWSPFEGHTFHSTVESTYVNGHLVFNNGIINDTKKGERMLFDRH